MRTLKQRPLEAMYESVELDGLNRYDFRFYPLDDWEQIQLCYRHSRVCFILIRHIPGFVNHISRYGFFEDISQLNIQPWLETPYDPPVSIIGVLILKGIDEDRLKLAIDQYRFKYCP